MSVRCTVMYGVRYDDSTMYDDVQATGVRCVRRQVSARHDGARTVRRRYDDGGYVRVRATMTTMYDVR